MSVEFIMPDKNWRKLWARALGGSGLVLMWSPYCWAIGAGIYPRTTCLFLGPLCIGWGSLREAAA